MTYRGLRNIALAFATTLRMRSGQNNLQIPPRTIWRDKNECTKGIDCDQSQQCEYSKQNRPHGGLLDHKVGDPVPAGSHPRPASTNANEGQSFAQLKCD